MFYASSSWIGLGKKWCLLRHFEVLLWGSHFSQFVQFITEICALCSLNSWAGSIRSQLWIPFPISVCNYLAATVLDCLSNAMDDANFVSLELLHHLQFLSISIDELYFSSWMIAQLNRRKKSGVLGSYSVILYCNWPCLLGGMTIFYGLHQNKSLDRIVYYFSPQKQLVKLCCRFFSRAESSRIQRIYRKCMCSEPKFFRNSLKYLQNAQKLQSILLYNPQN